MKRSWRRRLVVIGAAVIGLGVGLALRAGDEAGVPVVIGAVVLFALVAHVAFNIPARHRVHSWGQVRQALDHRMGIFDRTYPEDSMGQVRVRQVGRNDRCPCGSGHKFKRCCGASSEAG